MDNSVARYTDRCFRNKPRMRINPGYHLLIRQGITSEPEAERLAREAPGGSMVKPASLKRQS